ncbi:MAG: hypothetical protein IT567_02620 [Alphaproteobacteria bacterium]|nr:hypothetical protein [Alphaproteobacteria bacterium]
MAKSAENQGASKTAGAGASGRPDDRKARLEAALRANLRRRKESGKPVLGNTDTL